LFSDIYEQYKDKLLVDHLVVLEAEIKHDSYNDSLGANLVKLWNITEARTAFCSGITVNVHHSQVGKQFIQSLNQNLAPFQTEGAKVCIQYEGAEAKALIELGQEYLVEPNDDLLYRLRDTFGDGNVTCQY